VTPGANSPSGGRRVATGCLIAFFLPFFTVGLGVFVIGARAVIHHAPAIVGVLPMLIGLVFLGVSSLVLTAALRGMKSAAEMSGFRAADPDKPWLWKKDWREGVIVSHGTTQSVLLAAFTVAWNAVSLPTAWMIYHRGLFRERPVELVVLIFPIIGLFLFVIAAYQLLRAMKYGASRVMLPHVPISLGSTVHGEIVTHVKERPEDGFTLKLACVLREVTGTGKSRTIRETELWREDQHVSPASVIPTMDGIRVPFAFRIPSDARPTDETISRTQVMWRLSASAETPGIDYAAQFDLPVFRTGETPHEPERFLPTASDAAMWMPPTDSRITIRPLPAGGDEIGVSTRPRGREIFPLFLFCAIWFGAIALIVATDAPIVIAVFFGVIGFFVMVAVTDAVIGRSTITANAGGVIVKRTWLGPIGYTKRIEAEAIESFGATPTANSPYFDVNVFRRNQSKLAVASYIANRKDAEMLAARLQHDVGAR